MIINDRFANYFISESRNLNQNLQMKRSTKRLYNQDVENFNNQIIINVFETLPRTPYVFLNFFKFYSNFHR